MWNYRGYRVRLFGTVYFSLADIAYRKSVSAGAVSSVPMQTVSVYNAGFRKITENLPKILGLSASVFTNYRSKYLRKKNTVGGSDLICVLYQNAGH